MKHFEKELPSGYIAAKVVDAKEKRTAIVLTVMSLVITAIVFAVSLIVLSSAYETDIWAELQELDPQSLLLSAAAYLVVYMAYIVLHELTHGLVYKIFTKQKLTFGMTLAVAFCGVPDIYVYRTAALCALLAPFVVFNVVFLLPVFFLHGFVLWQLVLLVIFAFHFGGCAGDLYDTALYLFKFRSSTTLMRDTGPKQTFYVLDPSSQSDVSEAQSVTVLAENAASDGEKEEVATTEGTASNKTED